MVGHDHVVACRERGVEPMYRPPESPHAFARARQLGALRAIDEARQHGLPPFHTDREEEELQTMMGEGEAHGNRPRSIFQSTTPCRPCRNRTPRQGNLP